MSGYQAVPRDALEVCANAREKGALVDLCELAQTRSWQPFPAPVRFLEQRWGESRRFVVTFLAKLEQWGAIQIERGKAGGRVESGMIRVRSPFAAETEPVTGSAREAGQEAQREAGQGKSNNSNGNQGNAGTASTPPPVTGSAREAGQLTHARGVGSLPRSEIGEIDPNETRQNQTIMIGEPPIAPHGGPSVAAPTPTPPGPAPAVPGDLPFPADTVSAVNTPATDAAPVPSKPPPRPRKPPAWSPDHERVWRAYRAQPEHVQAGEACPQGYRPLVAAAVAEYGADTIALVVEWAHQCRDDTTAWIQGRATGSERAYLGLDNLLRRQVLPSRVELARAWEAAGKPTAQTAPASRPVRRDEGPARPLTIAEQVRRMYADSPPGDDPLGEAIDTTWRSAALSGGPNGVALW